jgi:hypothetical protein
MARKSLKPQLNQIRTWVREGRTDAWIAHKLEVTVQQISQFKRENELAPEGADGDGVPPEEIDLRAEDDALIAVELEKAAAEAEAEAEAEAARKAAAGDDEDDGDADEDDDDEAKPRARRSRRGGRGRRRKGGGDLEGSFDHGEEGYGLWLDPAVQDDPVYAEHWAGHRPVTVKIEADQIVIVRAGDGAGDVDSGEDD